MRYTASLGESWLSDLINPIGSNISKMVEADKQRNLSLQAQQYQAPQAAAMPFCPPGYMPNPQFAMYPPEQRAQAMATGIQPCSPSTAGQQVVCSFEAEGTRYACDTAGFESAIAKGRTAATLYLRIGQNVISLKPCYGAAAAAVSPTGGVCPSGYKLMPDASGRIICLNATAASAVRNTLASVKKGKGTSTTKGKRTTSGGKGKRGLSGYGLTEEDFAANFITSEESGLPLGYAMGQPLTCLSDAETVSEHVQALDSAVRDAITHATQARRAVRMGGGYESVRYAKAGLASLVTAKAHATAIGKTLPPNIVKFVNDAYTLSRGEEPALEGCGCRGGLGAVPITQPDVIGAYGDAIKAALSNAVDARKAARLGGCREARKHTIEAESALAVAKGYADAAKLAIPPNIVRFVDDTAEAVQACQAARASLSGFTPGDAVDLSQMNFLSQQYMASMRGEGPRHTFPPAFLQKYDGTPSYMQRRLPPASSVSLGYAFGSK